MSAEVGSGAAYDDERGRLVPVELAEVPFVPARVFVVVATTGAVTRGGHAADCTELLVLVEGSASVTLTHVEGAPREHRLRAPGDRLLVAEGTHVEYTLDRPGSTVLVLADRPYATPAEGRDV